MTRLSEPYLSIMRHAGADVLLIAGERPGAELALREMRVLGVRWPVFGGDALTGIEADGALAEGVQVSTAYLSDRRDERNRGVGAGQPRAFPGPRPDRPRAGGPDAGPPPARAGRRPGPAPPSAPPRVAEEGGGRGCQHAREAALDAGRRRGAVRGRTAADRLTVNRLKQLHATIQTEYAVAHALKDLGRDQEAVAHAAAVRPQAAQLTRLVRDLSRRQAQKAARAAERLTLDAGERERNLWVLVAALVVAGAFLSRYTLQSVHTPLGRLVTAAERLGAGDLRPVTTGAMPREFRVLADALQRMADRLRQIVGAVIAESDQIAGSACDLSAVSEQLAASSSEVSTAMVEISSGADQQRTALAAIGTGLQTPAPP